MLELNDRLLVTSPRTAARRGAIAAARRGQEQVNLLTALLAEVVDACKSHVALTAHAQLSH